MGVATLFKGRGKFLEQKNMKKATFLLAGSVTKTCEIEGITQAGIPGLIHLTPTLDAEFVDSGKLFSLDNIAETPKGVPTPAIITRAVRELVGFDFEVLDLGLRVKPKVKKLHESGLKESGRIDEGAGIDAKAVVENGMAFGENYLHDNECLILGESTPSGTTTAYATAKALGYDCDGYFSSSFLDAPASLKEEVVQKALQNVSETSDIYTKLGAVSDNMLLFSAGFASSYSQRGKIVLGGGTQMAAVLLLMEKLQLPVKWENVALMTTKWVYEDPRSDIAALVGLLAHEVDAYYADFDFSEAAIPVLQLYDKGEAKEGVGAGAALCYALSNGFDKSTITKEVERVLTS